MSVEAAQADLAASLRSDLNNEFPSVDYSRDFHNPIMLKALLFAARARDKHSKSRNLAGGSDDRKTKRARLAEARPGGKGKGAFPGKGKDKPTTHLRTGKGKEARAAHALIRAAEPTPQHLRPAVPLAAGTIPR